jgi:hypothetical protein
MQTSPIPMTYRESDAFFYEDLSIFLLKAIGNAVNFDNGTTLNVPQGVWKVPFEFSIPKEVNRSYSAVYSKYYWEIALKLDISGSRDLETWTNIQIV